MYLPVGQHGVVDSVDISRMKATKDGRDGTSQEDERELHGGTVVKGSWLWDDFVSTWIL